MSPAESSPLLLESGTGSDTQVTTVTSEPSWIQSYKFFFFGSWANILLVFVPLSYISHQLKWDAVLRFSFSFISILPLAKLIGTATNQLSLKLTQTLSGLLNASFGNAVELIVGVVALLQGEIQIVQTSLLGSILSNLLLVLGCSFLAGGLNKLENEFGKTGAQASTSLMTLACFTMVIPAAYYTSNIVDHRGSKSNSSNDLSGLKTFSALLPNIEERYADGILFISRGTAIVLLVVYAVYIYFQLGSHKDFFDKKKRVKKDTDAVSRPNGIPQRNEIPQHGIPQHNEIPQHNGISQHPDPVKEKSEMSIAAAGSSLVLIAFVTSFCAEYLVASIEETAERYHVPKAFIGLILLPLAANAAEHVTSIWMATKDKMELSIGICVGSSIQIAAFVVPLLVIIGWITHHDFTLVFANFETIILFASVLLVNFLIQDGKSNYMEGIMLIALYLVVCLAFWVS